MRMSFSFPFAKIKEKDKTKEILTKKAELITHTVVKINSYYSLCVIKIPSSYNLT